jgi:hypothetical protein
MKRVHLFALLACALLTSRAVAEPTTQPADPDKIDRLRQEAQQRRDDVMSLDTQLQSLNAESNANPPDPVTRVRRARTTAQAGLHAVQEELDQAEKSDAQAAFGSTTDIYLTPASVDHQTPSIHAVHYVATIQIAGHRLLLFSNAAGERYTVDPAAVLMIRSTDDPAEAK